jgi:hypothetical protein
MNSNISMNIVAAIVSVVITTFGGHAFAQAPEEAPVAKRIVFKAEKRIVERRVVFKAETERRVVF